MKAIIVYDIDGWAYARRAKALAKYAPPNCVAVLVKMADVASIGDTPHDVCLLLDYANISVVARHTSRPLVCSFSADCNRRGGMWWHLLAHADWVICLSRERYEARGGASNCCCIANGVDQDDFYCEKPIESRTDKVLWIGRDTDDGNKGWHDVLFPLQRLARQKGFEPDFRVIGETHEPMDTNGLRKWYNTGAYVVCASRSEATANVVMEAAACGCVPVSTPVGTLTDWAQDGENCVLVKDRSPEAFLVGLQKARDARFRLTAGAMDAVAKYDYRRVTSLYWEKVFRPLAEGRKPKTFCYLETLTWIE